NSTELLDNLGISLKVSQAQEIYAKRLGVTVSKLNDVQRAEAFRLIGAEKVIEAAKGLTLETDNAGSAIRRMAVEAENTRDKLLGAEERTISLKQAIMQMAEEERKLILSARTYGSDAIKVRQIVTDLGVSYEDASVSLSRYASLLEDV